MGQPLPRQWMRSAQICTIATTQLPTHSYLPTLGHRTEQSQILQFDTTQPFVGKTSVRLHMEPTNNLLYTSFTPHEHTSAHTISTKTAPVAGKSTVSTVNDT